MGVFRFKEVWNCVVSEKEGIAVIAIFGPPGTMRPKAFNLIPIVVQEGDRLGT
jgi:hypothetical protein